MGKIDPCDDAKFWKILYVYIPLALLGIFFFGPIITPSYYTLIFLGIIPLCFLLRSKKIQMGDVKKSFLYSLPVLWPFVVDLILGLYRYGSEVRWQWPHGDPFILSPWNVFDRYVWHPFVIFSFSWNLFFLGVVQTTLQKRMKPTYAVLATTCIWTLFFLSFMLIDGSLPVNIQNMVISTAGVASLFLICSYAFYKSNSITGQIALFGIFMSLLR